MTTAVLNPLNLAAQITALRKSGFTGLKGAEEAKESKPGVTTADATNAAVALDSVAGPGNESRLRTAMLRDLDLVAQHYEVLYAPSAWKNEQFGWELSAALETAKKAVADIKDVSVKAYHQILRDFIHSMKDYHVSVSFASTETASLPFTVASAGDKFFIGHIDREKLPVDAFPFAVGDELVEFNGRPPLDVIKELEAEIGNNVPETDRALASGALTKRAGRKALTMPEDELIGLKIKSQHSGTVSSHQLAWTVTQENVTMPHADHAMSNGKMDPALAHALLNHTNMSAPFVMDGGQEVVGNPFAMGARQSFVPKLGTVLTSMGPDSPYDSYMYKADDGKIIGYVRIPSYSSFSQMSPEEHVEIFSQIITHYENTTDALVIDQVNNPGGSVFYLYALASMLTDQPLKTPKHKMSVTSDLVSSAHYILAELGHIRNDEDAKAMMGEKAQGFPITYSFVQKQLAYARHIIETAESGADLSTPTHIGGVDEINPSTTARYTKPIVVLTNELDFSGGDFFPAIMQDNGRATIVGTRTAGAGGVVHSETYPNRLGVMGFSITGSLAERPDGARLENLGVTPDVEYSPTEFDLQNGFAGYRQMVNAVVSIVTSPADIVSSDDLTLIDGVGNKMQTALQEAGYVSYEAIAEASASELAEVNGVGKNSAKAIIREAKQLAKMKQRLAESGPAA